MKPGQLTWLLAAAVVTGTAGNAWAQLVAIDMDPSSPGTIETTLTASNGDPITVAVVLDLGASYAPGVFSYGITVRFDTVELSFNGAPASANTIPAGWTSFAPTPTETENIGGGLGEVFNFNAFDPSFAASLGSGMHVLGTISFTADGVSGDLGDITPYITAGFDGIIDSGGLEVTSSFVLQSGAVVPEPAHAGLVVGLGLLFGVAGRRWLSKAQIV